MNKNVGITNILFVSLIIKCLYLFNYFIPHTFGYLIALKVSINQSPEQYN